MLCCSGGENTELDVGVDILQGLYLLLSVCKLVIHKGHQFAKRWTVAGIKGPALTHHVIPAEESPEIKTGSQDLMPWR